MTAVVGILNKHAVAIAADSAVTIGNANGKKIFNRANKVFTLSKYHPVGVMLYNSASFMSTPWETIIKVFRQHLGDKNFPTIKEFQEEFIIFLRSQNFYAEGDDSKKALLDLSLILLNTIWNDIVGTHNDLFTESSDENNEKVLDYFEEKINSYIDKFERESNFCEDFIDYTLEEFNIYFSEKFGILIENFQNASGFEVSDQFKERFNYLIYIYVKTKESFSNFTGLIFTGFGSNEIYPCLIPVNISLSIGERLRYYIDEEKSAQITNDNNGAICPFAQTDVIDTILTGVDPKLDEIYTLNFYKYLKKYNETILNLIGDTNSELSEVIGSLDVSKIVTEFKSQILETKKINYIYPLMNAVSSLSKEDLAEMAESLIYLTYLKRRITFAEESVGGPVDVAIISKGDGFVWIKRKHYFDPKLNKQFFDNYFNK